MPGLLDRLDRLPPEVRGPTFERLTKWWLTAGPVYAAQLRRVWLWSEWPGRWGADAGIDLVAETHDGDLWAIQTKAYADGASVTKAGVDSFLSESNRATFSYRLLVATTNRIAPNAERAMQGQEKGVGIVRRRDLQASTVRWPRSLETLAAPKPKPRKPRSHQRRAIRDVLAGFAEHDRGQLIMACGTGKTLTALWIAEQLDADRTLVLVPSLSLLEQTLREWLAAASEPFPFLAVCSDATVAPEHDEPVASTADLGVPVTTDPDTVRTFLRRRGRRVVFATYQSSPVVAEAQAGGRVPQLDLVVADEAHRCAGAVSGAFGTVLDGGRIRARRRLYMTATPRYFTGRLRRGASEADLELASMDDEERFGPVLHRLTFGDAIRRQLLADYRVLVTAVDHPTYAWMVAQAELVRDTELGETDARTLARQVTLLRAMAKHGLRRVLSFHSRVARARRFAQELPDVATWAPEGYRPDGTLWASWVSGEMNVADRSARLDYLRHLADDERVVLTNARCLAEGVDVPAIDGVAFIDPRRSQVDVVQAVGRAIRRSDDKTVGTIILPVLVEPGQDAEAVLQGSEFDAVWQVVRALRAHDEELAEQLDEARRRLGRLRTRAERPGKLVLDLPVELSDGFALAFDTRLVDATTESWQFSFGLLERYAAREKHASPLIRHQEEGYNLGQWVAYQRRVCTDPGRRALLESLPGWQWSPKEASWEEGYARLLAYAEREGNSRVGRHHVEPDGHELGRWLATQRATYRRGGLTPDKRARLEHFPDWEASPFDAQWEAAFAVFRRYVAATGSVRLTNDQVVEGVALGAWLKKQRAAAAAGRLSARRVALLDGLGWDPHPKRSRFLRNLAELTRYAEEHQTVRVPDGHPLQGWLNSVRMAHKNGTLRDSERQSLEGVPHWSWDPKGDRWLEAAEVLADYARQKGHASPTYQESWDGFPIGKWLAKQRTSRRAGRLRSDREAFLDGLGVVWEPREATWRAMFAVLVSYCEERGTSLVPSTTEYRDTKLGQWVWVQRNRYRTGKMPSDEASALEALPGWTWTPPIGGRDSGKRRLARST